MCRLCRIYGDEPLSDPVLIRSALNLARDMLSNDATDEQRSHISDALARLTGEAYPEINAEVEGAWETANHDR